MNVTISEQEVDTVDASIVGELDADNCSELRPALIDVCSNGSVVTLDIGQLTFLDSSGISALLELRSASVESGSQLVLRSPTDAVRRVLEITGLLATFGIGG